MSIEPRAWERLLPPQFISDAHGPELPPLAGEEAGDHDCPHCGVPLRYGKELLPAITPRHGVCDGIACRECHGLVDVTGMRRLEEQAWENADDEIDVDDVY